MASTDMPNRRVTVKPRRGRARRGTTLIEILVVIVVFLVGILAVVQIFPGGLKILNQTRNRSVAANLARDQMEQLKGRSDQMPDEILPVRYVFNGGNVAIVSDPNRSPNDLGLSAAGIDGLGNAVDGSGNILGPWAELSGANVARRIVGEGSVIPSPKTVGAYYGSMMILQFAPVLLRPGYDSTITVYGNDMDRIDGVPADALKPYEYFVNQLPPTQPTLYLPTVSPATYRLALSYYVNAVGGLEKRDLVDGKIVVNAAGIFYTLRLDIGDVANPNPLGLQAGETLASIDYGSVKIARRFDQIAVGAPFSANTPYEYKVIDSNLGLVLFNPVGYGYKVVTSEGSRVPLRGRVNYDVLDWRIIHEEFRLNEPINDLHHLSLGSLKIAGEQGADGRPETGLDMKVPDGAGGFTNESVVVLDMETGGIVLNRSGGVAQISIGGSQGVLSFHDSDPGAEADLSLMEVLPGQTVATDVNIIGKPLRALYQAKGEWAVNVLKAAASYSSSSLLPGIAQYYVGASNGAVGGNATRIYFPLCDAGRKVSVGAIWYLQQGSLRPTLMQDQTFTIKAALADPLSPLPSIDLRDIDSNAIGFDFSNGYAVRGLTGASVAVRVMWNPAAWNDSGSPNRIATSFGNWLQTWRRETTETYLTGGRL